MNEEIKELEKELTKNKKYLSCVDTSVNVSVFIMFLALLSAIVIGYNTINVGILMTLFVFTLFTNWVIVPVFSDIVASLKRQIECEERMEKMNKPVDIA